MTTSRRDTEQARTRSVDGPARLGSAAAPAKPPPSKLRQLQLAGLDAFIRAVYPVIYVSTSEEGRFLARLREKYGPARPVFQWTYTKGLINLQDGRCIEQTTIGDPLAALRYAEKTHNPGLFVFCDLHPWLRDNGGAESRAAVRMLRDYYHHVRSTGNRYKVVLLVSPVLVIPPELEKEVVVFDFPLPDREELRGLLDAHMRRTAREAASPQDYLPPDHVDKLLEAALGLTLDEADNAFSAALLKDGRLDSADIHTILAQKQLIIRQSGVLDYYPAEEDLTEVGGLENLKAWLRKRALAFSREARDFGLPHPKGVLLTGVQGCGKSLSAKAIATNWQLPLLRLDVGKLFAGLVGSSEENMRRAIKLSEAIAPCVLWVDELEKGFSGLQSSGSVDGGTTARVFGTFLTWLQDKKSNVFVVATANQIQGLPPELLRKGRFDEIFFIDLPDAAERAAILDIHLQKRRRNPGRFDVGRLVRETERFSGAELEQVVISALYEAFSEGQDLQMAHLLAAIRQTVPLSVTMAEDVEFLRHWAKTRAVAASIDRHMR
ncbi:MAG: AAA family ATPase [Candidatus Sericytochromatia bacterium]|nr:AAA family ATPase [Candidatus Tanganyikabacteria bacterium]